MFSNVERGFEGKGERLSYENVLHFNRRNENATSDKIPHEKYFETWYLRIDFINESHENNKKRPTLVCGDVFSLRRQWEIETAKTRKMARGTTIGRVSTIANKRTIGLDDRPSSPPPPHLSLWRRIRLHYSPLLSKASEGFRILPVERNTRPKGSGICRL